MRSRLICLAVLLSGMSLSALAYEAPVVDATAQPSMSTQSAENTAPTNTAPPAEQMTSGSWQPVASNNNTENTAPSSQNSGWQTAASNNNAQSQQAAVQMPAPKQELEQAPTHAQTAQTRELAQRVSRLEQQAANNAAMNLPQQVSDLHNQVAQLQGQLEVDQHQLATLTSQQKLYYQDIEQQIASDKNLPNKKAQLTDDSAAANTQTAANTPPANIDNGSNVNTQLASNNQSNADSTDANSNQSNNQPGQFQSMELTKKTPSLSDADSYDKAFRLLSHKHFIAAQTAFNAYLSDYPRGHFSVNAHFWLGEIALMNEKYKPALAQFKTVVTDYPTSNKVSDAQLKIAMIHAATGKMAEARREFAKIRSEYPGSTAAQLASIRLQQLANATSTTLQ